MVSETKAMTTSPPDLEATEIARNIIASNGIPKDYATHALEIVNANVLTLARAYLSAKPGIPQAGELRERLVKAVYDFAPSYDAQDKDVPWDKTSQHDRDATYALVDVVMAVLPSPAEVEALREERDDLKAKVYVPGMWKCAKCGLKLTARVMDSDTGNLGCDERPQKCLNGCGPMWHLTEREHADEMANLVVDTLAREKASEARASQLAEKVRALRDAARNLLNNSINHYMHAEDMFCMDGALEAADVALAQPEASAKATTREDDTPAFDMLLGSNVQRSYIDIGDRKVQLGEIVRWSVKRGNYTAETWNALSDYSRELRIQKTIDWLRMIEDEPGGIMAGNPHGPMGEFVRAELERQTVLPPAGRVTGPGEKL